MTVVTSVRPTLQLLQPLGKEVDGSLGGPVIPTDCSGAGAQRRGLSANSTGKPCADTKGRLHQGQPCWGKVGKGYQPPWRENLAPQTKRKPCCQMNPLTLKPLAFLSALSLSTPAAHTHSPQGPSQQIPFCVAHVSPFTPSRIPLSSHLHSPQGPQLVSNKGTLPC